MERYRTALPGYARLMVLSGKSHYANVEPSPKPDYAVSGTVFEITEQELSAADKSGKPTCCS